MRTILVTGISGLVGSYVAHALISAGYKVVGIYNKKVPHHNVAGVHYIQADLTDSSALDVLTGQYDAIVHSAALIPSVTHSDTFCYLKNRLIDDNVISFAIKTAIKCVIFVSSIYVSDSTRLANSQYLLGKIETERILKQLPETRVLRISSPYGLGQNNKNVLKLFVDNVIEGKDLYYHGTGQRTQDFIHALDIADAVIKALEAKDNEHIVLNIASGKPISMRDLALLVTSIHGQTKTEVRPSGSKDVEEDFRANFDISETANRIGWKPSTSLEKGIRQWLTQLKQNGNRYYI